MNAISARRRHDGDHSFFVLRNHHAATRNEMLAYPSAEFGIWMGRWCVRHERRAREDQDIGYGRRVFGLGGPQAYVHWGLTSELTGRPRGSTRAAGADSYVRRTRAPQR